MYIPPSYVCYPAVTQYTFWYKKHSLCNMLSNICISLRLTAAIPLSLSYICSNLCIYIHTHPSVLWLLSRWVSFLMYIFYYIYIHSLFNIFINIYTPLRLTAAIPLGLLCAYVHISLDIYSYIYIYIPPSYGCYPAGSLVCICI